MAIFTSAQKNYIDRAVRAAANLASQISSSTNTNIAGLLKGASGKVAQAVVGIDYLEPSTLLVSLSNAGSLYAARVVLGVTNLGDSIITAGTAAAARFSLGSGAKGDAIFTAGTAADVATALGGGDSAKAFFGDGNWRSLAFARVDVSLVTATLANNATETGSVALGKSFKLLTISVSAPCRVRLYQTAAYRDADASRAIGTDPTGEHGLITDDNLVTGNLTLDLPGFVFGDNKDASPSSNIYYSVQNLSGGSAAITVTFTRIVLEG